MIYSDLIDEALSAETRDRIRAHPAFIRTAEALAADGLHHTYSHDEDTRWLTKDMGRTALYITTLMFEAAAGRVMTSDLIAAAGANGTCSRGRVLAWVRYALNCGRLGIREGEGHWTKRPLTLSPAFADFARLRLWREMAQAAAVLPEAAQACPLRDDPGAFRAVLVAAGQAHALRREAFREVEAGLQPFMTREAGMRVLNELVGRQPPGRSRLLETATFSRRDLASKLTISRVHINTLLKDAAAEGLLTLVPPDGVSFSPELSSRAERHFAFRLQLQSLYANVLLQTFAANR